MTTEDAVVSISKIGPEAEDSQIEEQVFKAVELVGGIPAAIERAPRILVKPNLGYFDTRTYNGRLVALTEPSVTGAVLRMLRDVTKKEIILADGPYPEPISEVAKAAGYGRILKKYGAKLLDANQPPYVNVAVPANAAILRTYQINKEIASAVAVISIAKMKSHLLTGVSLCMKNLFGLAPVPVYGYWNARWYLHYPIRLPRCLVDLTSIFKPCLNVIDGVVGETVQEWLGPAIESNVILAGNNAVATDAVGAEVMGFDPLAEFPQKPFLFDTNHLRLAADADLGPVDPSEIKIRGEEPEDVKSNFDVRYLADLESSIHLDARRKLAEEARWYNANAQEIVRLYNGKVVCVEQGRVSWSSERIEDLETKFKPRHLTVKYKSKTGSGYTLPFIKKVVPVEEDPEIFDAYLAP